MEKYQGMITKLFVAAPVLVACLGSLAYVLIGLTTLSLWLVIILAACGTIWFVRSNNSQDDTSALSSKIPVREWRFFTPFIVCSIISLYLLYAGKSERAILTPWQVVSSWYFVSFSIATILLFFLVKASSRLTKYALIIHAFLLYGVAAIVYGIGYGFDPFIHEAALKAIEQLGQIKPLTPYYLGHYSIILVLKTISGLSIHFWSKFLIPVMAAILFPLLITRWLSHHHGLEKNWMAPALFLFMLPASLFIAGTPQSLAYIFLMIVIFWPTPKYSTHDKILTGLAALAAFVTQPIAGIAACLIVAYDLSKDNRHAKKIYSFIILGFIFALPAALYLVSRFDASTDSSFVFPRLGWLLDFWPANPVKSSVWLNFSYLFNGLQSLLTALLALAGIIIALSSKSLELIRRYVWPGLSLLLACVLASSVNFHFLIDYERSDYPQRILITALIVCLPLVLISLERFSRYLSTAPRTVMLSILIASSAAISANMYLSYPRYDDFENSHSYATSKADILATHWIDEDAHGTGYAVLANQQVSAAALREFGFAHYLKDGLFYYPIPTGAPLYGYFLKIVEVPKRSTVLEAMETAGVNRMYVVLNNYWWRFKYLAPELEKIADETKDIGDGQVKIYRFTK